MLSRDELTTPLKPKEGLNGAPSITVSALSRDTWTSEGFAFPFVEVLFFDSRSLTKARFQNPAVDICSTSHLFGHSTSDHDSWFRLPARPGGKALHQANGDLLLHQGAPRAALHANQLRVVHLATQHPVHPHRQFPGDRDLRYAAATTQP